jgi:hypothetical protein
MNQSKGVLVAFRGPGGTFGPENGPYSVPGGPREARRAEQDLIDVLKTYLDPKRTSKRHHHERAIMNIKGSHWGPKILKSKIPREPAKGTKGPIMNIKGSHWGPMGSLGPSGGTIKILSGPVGALRGPNNEP